MLIYSKQIPGYPGYKITQDGKVYTVAGKLLAGCLAVDAKRYKLINENGKQDSCTLPWLLWVTYCQPPPTKSQKVFSSKGNFDCSVTDLSLVPRHSKISVDVGEYLNLKKAGLTSKEISARFGISVSSLKRALAESS
jgi:hypothetical protein